MRTLLIILLFTCVCCKMHAQVFIIKTIAGKDSAGYSGDGGQATDAKLNTPDGICIDKFGNVLIADAFNHCIRKVLLSTGVIKTIAGNGTPGFSGDGSLATSAQLFIPEGIVTDTSGNIYITDAGNNRIRKISVLTGLISTVAGSGPTGILTGNASGDGGMATEAQLNNPSGLCVDNSGNIFIADYENQKIRKVTRATGIITTIAGTGVTGYSGDNIPATNASLNDPIQVFVDADENVFICDQSNNRIRRVDAMTGIITTVAGNGVVGYSGDNGPATDATLSYPMGIYIDKQNNFFIAEQGNGTVRKIDAISGIMTTVAGTGIWSYSGDGGPATNANMRCANVFLDNYGSMYISDEDNNRIRIVYDTTLQVRVKEVSKIGIKMYPNPTSNELTIEGAEGYELSIYNITGQFFDKLRMTKNKETINIASLVPAMYIIQIVSPSGEKQVRKFVKE